MSPGWTLLRSLICGLLAKIVGQSWLGRLSFLNAPHKESPGAIINCFGTGFSKVSGFISAAQGMSTKALKKPIKILKIRCFFWRVIGIGDNKSVEIEVNETINFYVYG